MSTQELTFKVRASVPADEKLKYAELAYLHFDPFHDRDVEIKCETRRLVKVRADRECYMGLVEPQRQHFIKRGELARLDSALVDGKWGSYHLCIPCIEAALKELE